MVRCAQPMPAEFTRMRKVPISSALAVLGLAATMALMVFRPEPA